jgi:hypothetical protein
VFRAFTFAGDAGHGAQGEKLSSAGSLGLCSTMPPVELNDREMAVLTELAAPIEERLRPDFLRAVAAELEAQASAGAIGEGVVHRIGRVVQRAYFNPPTFGEGRR